MTRPRRTRAAVLVVAVVLVLGACGDGSPDRGEGSGPGSGPTRPQPRPGAAGRYVGLKTAEAIARAEADGRPWRIAREDGESFPLTQDFVENRVNFEIEDGVVVLATFG
jgi:hypothetical protein